MILPLSDESTLESGRNQQNQPLMIQTDRRRLQNTFLVPVGAHEHLVECPQIYREKWIRYDLLYSLQIERKGKSYVEVQVKKIKDTGLGIKRKDKGKLFKLFGFV